MSRILFRNTEFGCKEIEKDSVHAFRWDEPGGIQAIHPLRSRTSLILNSSSAFGQEFRFRLRWILTPPLTHFRPARPACGLRASP
jgi:hypothetical protein